MDVCMYVTRLERPLAYEKTNAQQEAHSPRAFFDEEGVGTIKL